MDTKQSDTWQAFEQGRRTGLYDALEFITGVLDTLPKDQRYLIHDLVWIPLHEETKRRHAEIEPSDTPEVHEVKSLHDLPIFGWAWSEDGRDLQA